MRGPFHGAVMSPAPLGSIMRSLSQDTGLQMTMEVPDLASSDAQRNLSALDLAPSVPSPFSWPQRARQHTSSTVPSRASSHGTPRVAKRGRSLHAQGQASPAKARTIIKAGQAPLPRDDLQRLRCMHFRSSSGAALPQMRRRQGLADMARGEVPRPETPSKHARRNQRAVARRGSSSTTPCPSASYAAAWHGQSAGGRKSQATTASGPRVATSSQAKQESPQGGRSTQQPPGTSSQGSTGATSFAPAQPRQQFQVSFQGQIAWSQSCPFAGEGQGRGGGSQRNWHQSGDLPR